MADPKIVLTAEDKTKAAFESVKSNLAGIQTKAVAVTGAIGALGVTAWAAGMARDVMAVTEEWDELGKAAQRAGFQSAQTMAEYQFAAKLAGVEAGGFESAVGKLNAKMADAVSGNKEAAATFAAMGLKVKGANGELRASEEVLAEIAEKFASWKDGPEKSALAMDLFGKAGRELIPLLNGGRAGLEEVRAEFRALHGQVSDQNVKDAERFNDNLTKLEAASKSLARSLTGDLLKALVQVTDQMVDAAKRGGLFLSALAGAAELGRMLMGVGAKTGAGFLDTKALADQTQELKRLSAEVQRLEGLKKSGRLGSEGEVFLTMARESFGAAKARFRQSDATYRAGRAGMFDIAADDAMSRRLLRGEDKPQAPIAQKPDAAAQSAYDAVIKRIQERLAGQTAELEKGRALTEQEKFEIKVTQDLAAAKLTLTVAGQKLLAQTAAQDAALKRNADRRAEAKALEDEQQRNQDELSASLAADAREWDRYQVQLLGATQSLKDNSRELELEGRMINATDKERRIAIESLRIQLDLEQKLRELDNNRALGPTERAEARGKLEAQAAEATRQAISRAGLDESREFAGTLREDVKGALTTAFRDSKNVLGSFGDALANVIYTRASSAVADALLGKMGLGAGATGNYFGGLTKLLGVGGPSPAGFLNDAGGLEVLGSLGFHRGGEVGRDAPTFQRALPAAMFRNAPRYHRGGLASNEVAAVLEEGEEVITAKDPRHRRNGGAQGSPVNITINQTVGDVATQSMLADNNRALKAQISAALRRAQTYGG